MEVNDKLIDDLSRLARLHFDDAEKIEIRADLEKMITFVEKLNELDTSGTEPLLHITSGVNRMREDEVNNMCTREEALSNARGADEMFFRVPKVIRK